MRPRAAEHPFGPRTDACNRRCSPETLLPAKHAASVEIPRTTPFVNSFALRRTHNASRPRGKCAYTKGPGAHPRKTPAYAAGILRKWPQVPARRFCPMRAIGLLACRHPPPLLPGGSRWIPAASSGVQWRARAGLLPASRASHAPRQKTNYRQLFLQQSEYIMKRTMSTVPLKESREVRHNRIISLLFKNTHPCQPRQDFCHLLPSPSRGPLVQRRTTRRTNSERLIFRPADFFRAPLDKSPEGAYYPPQLKPIRKEVPAL